MNYHGNGAGTATLSQNRWFRQNLLRGLVFSRRSLPLFLCFIFAATPAEAAFLHGEALDKFSDILSWVVLIVVPVVVISVFWIVHILPEKIAYKKHHPQAKAIHTLCLLSLFFGGLLWPLAWLWAYTEPVFYKMAYGVDKVDHGHGDKKEEKTPVKEPESELEQLRLQNARLEEELHSLKSQQKMGDSE